jgi:hypothetical protein
MEQHAYNLWSIILQACSVLVSAVVGYIVLHYTREAKRLREATDDQVKLLREQSRAASTPFIIPGFDRWSPGGTQFTAAPIRAVRGSLSLSLTNATLSPAIDVHAIFRKDNAQYYYSVTIRDVIPPSNPLMIERFEMLGPLSPTDLKGAIKRDFGTVPEALFSEILRPREDYLFALFRNTKAESFLTGRKLTVRSDGAGVDWPVSSLYP